MGTSAEYTAAVIVQRHWRGLRSRQLFSTLFFERCVSQLQQEDMLPGAEVARMVACLPVSIAHAESDETSLEEARAEASAGSHFLIAAPCGCGAAAADQPGAGSALGRSGTVALSSPLRVDHGPEAVDAACDSQCAAAQSEGGAACCSSGGGGHACVAAGGHRFAVGTEGLGELAELQFTEEMANEMDLEALRELSSVLSRIIVARNKLLVSLLQKRDELLHEHTYREQLVAQLLEQVGKSRGLKRAQKGRKPSFG